MHLAINERSRLIRLQLAFLFGTYCLFYDAVSMPDCIAPKAAWVAKNEIKESAEGGGHELLQADYPGISLDELRKTKKNLRTLNINELPRYSPLIHLVEEVRTALNTPPSITTRWRGGGPVPFNTRTCGGGQSCLLCCIQSVTEIFRRSLYCRFSWRIQIWG